MPTLKELSPALWFSLHTISGSYPENPTEEEKEAAINLIYSLIYLFPCPRCRNHLVEFLRRKPIENYVNNRESFERWMYEYHEDVNDNSNVPRSKRSSFEEIQRAFRPGPWKNSIPGYWYFSLPSLNKEQNEKTYMNLPNDLWTIDDYGNLKLKQDYLQSFCSSSSYSKNNKLAHKQLFHYPHTHDKHDKHDKNNIDLSLLIIIIISLSVFIIVILVIVMILTKRRK